MFWIARQLKRLRREATPSNAYKDALLRRILGSPAPRHAFRFAAVGIASVALIFGTGTGVYAYDSPKVVDGHPLYFVKQGLETVEGQFATTPEARARYHARMMERRMAEAEAFVAEQERVGQLLQSASDELDRSVDELILAPNDPVMRRAVIQYLSEQNARYEQVMERVPVREGMRRMPPPPEAMRERLDTLNTNDDE